MIDLAAFDEPLTAELDSRVWIEPKDRAVDSEHARQAEFIAAMRKTSKRCLAFAVPNGTNITSMRTRRIKRDEGLTSGVPDVVVCWTGAIAYIEFKNGKDMPDPNQVECINRLITMEFPVMVARTAPGALAWLRSIGAPVPAVTA